MMQTKMNRRETLFRVRHLYYSLTMKINIHEDVPLVFNTYSFMPIIH